ncbi:MAG: hypothetical protein QOD39_2812, partial [Mycobacterium sp.]|nr:hypothetical protein [Mycobacterium sp.]
MVSLIVHAILGIAAIALIIKMNPAVFARVPGGAAFSAMEIALYVIG